MDKTNRKDKANKMRSKTKWVLNHTKTTCRNHGEETKNDFKSQVNKNFAKIVLMKVLKSLTCGC